MSNCDIKVKKKKHLAASIILAVAMFMVYLNCIIPQYDDRYAASLIDKVERLESIDEPKIVLLGNSNLVFGIDSEKIEEAIGMPVVNMGLAGSLGNAFHENMAKYNICPGDIYVICHSEFDDEDTIPAPVEAWVCIENHFKLWKLIRWKDVPNMFFALPSYIQRCINKYAFVVDNYELAEGEKRSAFNKYGDMAIKREYDGYTCDMVIAPSEISDECVNRINALNEYMTSRGAHLVVAGYPIMECETTVSESEFDEFQRSLSEQLECSVISNYNDYRFDKEYFYGFMLHLTSAGAELRTEQLIKDLQQYIEEDIINAAVN